MAIWTAIQHALIARGIGVGKAGADGIMGADTWRGVDTAIRQASPQSILAAIETVPLPSAVPPVSAATAILTAAVIRKVCPVARDELVNVLAAGAGQLAASGISTPLRAAHFLSEVATETSGLAAIEENLNYSVEGLKATFGRHRISVADCERYGRKPGRAANQRAIANLVYGGEWGRKNLGNTDPDDGWRYRGGGMMQTTGRGNYRRAGHEDRPEALRQPSSALESALKFWAVNFCNPLADRDDLAALRKRINGGTNGLAEAKAYLRKAKAALGI